VEAKRKDSDHSWCRCGGWKQKGNFSYLKIVGCGK
jgi:hypothetical protein